MQVEKWMEHKPYQQLMNGEKEFIKCARQTLNVNGPVLVFSCDVKFPVLEISVFMLRRILILY